METVFKSGNRAWGKLAIAEVPLNLSGRVSFLDLSEILETQYEGLRVGIFSENLHIGSLTPEKHFLVGTGPDRSTDISYQSQGQAHLFEKIFICCFRVGQPRKDKSRGDQAIFRKLDNHILSFLASKKYQVDRIVILETAKIPPTKDRGSFMIITVGIPKKETLLLDLETTDAYLPAASAKDSAPEKEPAEEKRPSLEGLVEELRTRVEERIANREPGIKALAREFLDLPDKTIDLKRAIQLRGKGDAQAVRNAVFALKKVFQLEIQGLFQQKGKDWKVDDSRLITAQPGGGYIFYASDAFAPLL